MEGSSFEAFLILVLTHLLIVVFKSHFSVSSSFLNIPDCKHREDKNDRDACPSFLRTKLLVQIRHLFTEKLKLVVRVDHIQEKLCRETDEHHVVSQLEKPSLKQQIHVTIDSCVGGPVVLI